MKSRRAKGSVESLEGVVLCSDHQSAKALLPIPGKSNVGKGGILRQGTPSWGSYSHNVEPFSVNDEAPDEVELRKVVRGLVN